MTFTKLQDVIEKIKRVHREVMDRCAGASETPDERTAWLAECFRQREETLVGLLDNLDEREVESVPGTWVQFVPDETLDQALARLRAAEDEGPDELLKEALEVHRSVSALVASLRDIMKSPGASEILETLAEYEEEITRRLGRADTTRFDV